MIEIWKPIVGYENYYEVSDLGNVRSIDRTIVHSNNNIFNYKSKILKSAINKYGYLQVGLSINSKTKSYCIHKLVAIAFIPNVNNKPTVNHKDGNKLNNYIDNLEWATKSEQAIHSLKNNLRKMPNSWIGKFGSKHGASKIVIQYDLNNNYIAEYGSIIEASKINNINRTTICMVCKNKKKTAGGYVWKYKNNNLK